MIQTKIAEKIKTLVLCSVLKILLCVGQCEKNIVDPGRPQMTTWHMLIVCWIAVNKHTLRIYRV